MGVDLLRDELIRFERQGDEQPTNQELEEWAAQARAKGNELPEPPKARRPEGPCRLCQERPSAHRCVACDRDACREDYWVMLGLCRECLTEEELAEARHREKTPPELDIKWVEE